MAWCARRRRSPSGCRRWTRRSSGATTPRRASAACLLGYVLVPCSSRQPAGLLRAAAWVPAPALLQHPPAGGAWPPRLTRVQAHAAPTHLLQEHNDALLAILLATITKGTAACSDIVEKARRGRCCFLGVGQGEPPALGCCWAACCWAAASPGSAAVPPRAAHDQLACGRRGAWPWPCRQCAHPRPTACMPPPWRCPPLHAAAPRLRSATWRLTE